MATSTVSMKLLIDTSKARRVLFAEASKDCVDFLFNILSLPVATVIRLLHGQGMEGSLPLPNLYQSLEALDDTYILPGKSKDFLLNPASSSPVPLLSLTAGEEVEKSFYACASCSYNRNYVCDDPRAICPNGHGKMSTKMTYVAPPAVKGESGSGEGGLVKGVVNYMVMDDLVIKPMSTISCIAMLGKLNVKDVGALEEKIVTLGMDEALKLLKTSLETNKVLTAVFCS